MAGQIDDDEEGMNSINITPMVDIMLVLLVIFMVTTTTINQLEGMQVDKPDAETGRNIEDVPKQILLVCRKDGQFLVDGSEVAFEEIGAKIDVKVAENPDIAGIVQCDEAAEVGQMVKLIDLLRDHKVKKYAIATEQPETEKARSGG